MPERNVAIVVFYDKEGNIIFQERGSVSKVGEKYGFWGGQREEGETPKQTIKRELTEELGFVPEKLDYWGDCSFVIKGSKNSKYEGWLVKQYVFLSLVSGELTKKVNVKEGKGIVKMNINKVIKGAGFPSGADSTRFLKEVKKQLYGNDKK